jgi:hypothetical protein
MMSAARKPGRPRVGLPLRHGVQVVLPELVKATEADAQLGGGGTRMNLLRSESREEMTHIRSRTTMRELEFFIAARIP